MKKIALMLALLILPSCYGKVIEAVRTEQTGWETPTEVVWLPMPVTSFGPNGQVAVNVQLQPMYYPGTPYRVRLWRIVCEKGTYEEWRKD